MSNLQVTPITGLPQVDGWAQVITHPSDPFFSVLAVSGQNANSVGKNLAEFLMNSHVESSSDLHHLLLDLLQKSREELCQIQCACFVVTPQKRVIAATYSGSLLLKRQEKIGEILASEGSLSLIEGNYKAGDIFVLLTQQAKMVFPDIKTRLQADSEHSITQLVADLQEQENSSLVTLAWVEEAPKDPENQNSFSDFKIEETHDLQQENLSSDIQNYEEKSDSSFTQDEHPLEKSKKVFAIGRGIKRGLSALTLKKIHWKELWKRKNTSFRSFAEFIKKRENPPFTREKLASDTPPSRFSFFVKASLGVIVILAGVIFWKQQSLQKEFEPFRPVLQNIEQQLEEIQSRPESEALEKRQKTKELLRQLEDLMAQNSDKSYSLGKMKESYVKVQAYSESISGTETQGVLEPFFDLRLVEPNFVTKQASLSGNSLFVLDAAGKTGILFHLENKNTQKISLNELESEADSVALQGETLFVLGNGLHQYQWGETSTHTRLKEEGDSDRDGTLLQSYLSYLYVINPEKRNIFRFLVKDNSVSEPIGWLIEKQGLDFASIKSFAVDGDVWLATQTGEILRYSRGEKQDFTLTDVQKPFDGPVQLATHENSDLLFVLDKANKRVVALQKNGTFVKETVSESLSSGDVIVALENEPAVLVISGSLVYKLSF